jgi:hypothetical protein
MRIRELGFFCAFLIPLVGIQTSLRRKKKPVLKIAGAGEWRSKSTRRCAALFRRGVVGGDLVF